MATSKHVKVSDISKPSKQLTHVELADLLPLPAPFDKVDELKWGPLKESTVESCECSLDDTVALNLPKPKTKEEEDELVRKFLSAWKSSSRPRTTGRFCSHSRCPSNTAPSARPVRTRARYTKPPAAIRCTVRRTAPRCFAASSEST